MFALDVSMQVWPSQASHIACFLRAVVSEQQKCILENLILLVLNAQIVICSRKVRACEIFKVLCRVVREDHMAGFRLIQTEAII